MLLNVSNYLPLVLGNVLMVCCGNADMRGIPAFKSTAAVDDPTKNNSKNTIDDRNTLVNRTWVLPLGMLFLHLYNCLYHMASILIIFITFLYIHRKS